MHLSAIGADDLWPILQKNLNILFKNLDEFNEEQIFQLLSQEKILEDL